MNTRIATIGSCFASHVATELDHRGYTIAMHPGGLWYNTFSIAQEFGHLFGESSLNSEPLWQTDDGYWIHPFKDYHKRFQTRDQLIEWAKKQDALARSIFQEAEIIIITLGLTEIWESVATGNVFLQIPPPDIHRRGVARFHPSRFDENMRNMESICDIAQQHTKAKLILTVSPVPLYATFRDMDVRIANNISKSTLRTVAAEFAARHEDVHYFHSYELVTSLDYPGAFMEEDRRHMRSAGVKLIIDEFLRTYANSALHPPSSDATKLLESVTSHISRPQPSTIVRRVLHRLRRSLARLRGGAFRNRT